MNAPHWWAVPAGTREASCRSCDAPIYWTLTANGARVPIDCDADGAYPPTPTADGFGPSHFLTCTNPAPFSGKNRRTS